MVKFCAREGQRKDEGPKETNRKLDILRIRDIIIEKSSTNFFPGQAISRTVLILNKEKKDILQQDEFWKENS